MDDRGETPSVELCGVTKRFDELVAVDDLSLDLSSGEFFTLLGPSGCGKTTTLRMIAGFERPTEGEIRIEGSDVAQLPPHKRPTNTVFQSYALFPHLTVEANVGFGLKRKKVAKDEIAERVRAELERVGLASHAKRKPSQLSGGMQQRVALARALVNLPKVLLLDEPLGALDLKLRKGLQVELKRIQREVGITFVYVTHDQEEALTMSDRVVLMRQGRIAQVGTPRELYDRPASRYVADFIGDTNLLAGRVEAVAEGRAVLRVGEADLAAACDPGLTAGGDAWLSVRPEAIAILRRDQPAPAGNLLEGRVAEAVYAGAQLRVHVEVDSGQRLVVAAPPDTPLR
ncbi:MAG TPA: ABC transporter ATP-binding protein, partial [Solirubrobacterales bacterium]|nr:ABC transporter ATP-binding protein [Solirubrobacterales bacterium]